jgi:DNA invertase Pin-like site-specific DNA recombinase
MALIGYARVSTDDQTLGPQLDVLKAAGCTEIFEEFASGADRARPELAAALARVKRGDSLVVVRIDRLARSLSHLLEVVEAIRARGAHFRSIADPIDTSGPSGVLVLQMLGAVAEFERSLIRERTKAGLVAAKARGRVGGNRLRAKDPDVLRKMAASRRATHLSKLLGGLDEWMSVVRRLRPARPWPEVADAVNAALSVGRDRFTTDRLVGSVKFLVAEGLADKTLLAGQRGRVCFHVSAPPRSRPPWSPVVRKSPSNRSDMNSTEWVTSRPGEGGDGRLRRPRGCSIKLARRGSSRREFQAPTELPA